MKPSFFRQNISLAWPMALNSLLVQSMVIVDLLLVAPLGEVSIAALGISSAIIAFLIGTQYALANGTQLLIARSMGASDTDKIALDVASGWTINLGLTLMSFCLLFFGSNAILGLISDHQDVITQADSYLRTMMYLLLLSSVTQVIIVFFNGSRKTRIPLYGFMLEIPINAVLSYVFINGLLGFDKMGLHGAALGSLCAMGIRLAYLMTQLCLDKTFDTFSGFSHITGKTLRAHFSEVSPIATNFVMLTSGIMMYQMLFAKMDVYSYAAITLVYPWMRFGSQFINAWAQATAINVSQFIGKKETHFIPDFMKLSIKVTCAVSLIMVLGFFIFSLFIPKFYPNMEPKTLHALALIAPIYILLPLVRTYNTICGNTLRAMGRSFKVLRIHVSTQWLISLPLCVLAIYLNAPIYIVFGIVIFEEVLKVIPFRNDLNKKIESYRA